MAGLKCFARTLEVPIIAKRQRKKIKNRSKTTKNHPDFTRRKHRRKQKRTDKIRRKSFCRKGSQKTNTLIRAKEMICRNCGKQEILSKCANQNQFTSLWKLATTTDLKKSQGSNGKSKTSVPLRIRKTRTNVVQPK